MTVIDNSLQVLPLAIICDRLRDRGDALSEEAARRLEEKQVELESRQYKLGFVW